MEPVFAGVVFTLCVLALVRLVLPAAWRFRVDAALRRAWYWLRVKALTLWRWPRMRREADRAARDAIERASRRATEGEWKGNVYEPKSFKKPKKPH
jgi:hypothetical protein